MSIFKQPPPWLVGLVVVVGVLAVSTSAIFVRLALTSSGVSGVAFSLFLSASRLALASILLLPAWRNFKLTPLTSSALGYAGAASICLALHFAAWITSLSFTSIAASTTLVTTNPVWVALLSWLWFKEKPSKLTLLGIGIALIGGVLIALGGAGVVTAGSNPLLGNFLALLGAWTVSMYLLLGREAQKRGLGISSYIAIVYSTAALVLLPFPVIFGSGYTGYSLTVYFYVMLMAIFPQLVGHTSLNWAVHWISPTLITLAILFEPVGASFLGYLIFKEVPSLSVIVGAVVLLIGVASAIYGCDDVA